MDDSDDSDGDEDLDEAMDAEGSLSYCTILSEGMTALMKKYKERGHPTRHSKGAVKDKSVRQQQHIRQKIKEEIAWNRKQGYGDIRSMFISSNAASLKRRTESPEINGLHKQPSNDCDTNLIDVRAVKFRKLGQNGLKHAIVNSDNCGTQTSPISLDEESEDEDNSTTPIALDKEQVTCTPLPAHQSEKRFLQFDMTSVAKAMQPPIAGRDIGPPDEYGTSESEALLAKPFNEPQSPAPSLITSRPEADLARPLSLQIYIGESPTGNTEESRRDASACVATEMKKLVPACTQIQAANRESGRDTFDHRDIATEMKNADPAHAQGEQDRKESRRDVHAATEMKKLVPPMCMQDKMLDDELLGGEVHDNEKLIPLHMQDKLLDDELLAGCEDHVIAMESKKAHPAHAQDEQDCEESRRDVCITTEMKKLVPLYVRNKLLDDELPSSEAHDKIVSAGRCPMKRVPRRTIVLSEEEEEEEEDNRARTTAFMSPALTPAPAPTPTPTPMPTLSAAMSALSPMCTPAVAVRPESTVSVAPAPVPGDEHDSAASLDEEVQKKSIRYTPPAKDDASLLDAMWRLKIISKDKKLDGLFRERVGAMLVFLRLYISDRGYTWTDAADLAAEVSGRGPYHSRHIRQWTWDYLSDHRCLPVNLYGNSKQSLISDEDISTEIREYIQALDKKYFTAEDVRDYINQPEFLRRMGRAKGFSLSTAIRWLKELDFTYGNGRKGMYIDGHEREDVVAYRRDEFLPVMAKYEEDMQWDTRKAC